MALFWDKIFPIFIDNGKNNCHDEKKLKKVWRNWEMFSPFAFNNSHDNCYIYISYQSAYLKAHYPSEFMKSVLRNNNSDIKSVNMKRS